MPIKWLRIEQRLGSHNCHIVNRLGSMNYDPTYPRFNQKALGLWAQPIRTFLHHDITRPVTVIHSWLGGRNIFLHDFPDHLLCGHDACRPSFVGFITVLKFSAQERALPLHLNLVLCRYLIWYLHVASLGNQPRRDTKRSEPGKPHKPNLKLIQTTSKVLPTNGIPQ